MTTNYSGIVPYLFFDEVEPAMAWYTHAFGFEEIGRWTNDDGAIQNAEMKVGNTEVWLDGSGRREDNDERPVWIGIWVDDVDAVHERLQRLGVECEEPQDRDFGVRMLNVDDGMGHLWGLCAGSRTCPHDNQSKAADLGQLDIRAPLSAADGASYTRRHSLASRESATEDGGHMGAREDIAAEFENAAAELERAAAHCRIASKRFTAHDVPSGCAHAFAGLGHIGTARTVIDSCAKTHSSFAQIPE